MREPKRVDFSSALCAFRTPFWQTVRPGFRLTHSALSPSLPIPSLVRPSVAISTPHLPFLVEMHEHLLSGRIRRAMCIFFYTVEQRDSSDLLRLIDKIRQLQHYHRFEKSPCAVSLYVRKKQGEELNGEFMRRCCRAKRSNAMLSMPRRARRVGRPPFLLSFLLLLTWSERATANEKSLH